MRIGTHTLPNWMIGSFFGDAAVTSDKLIETYANAAAYLADTTRSTRLFAVIGANIYSVAALESRNNNAALTDSNLPDTIGTPPAGVALGDNADAEQLATAAGSASEAVEGATALGFAALAKGSKSVAVGESSRVFDRYSVAVGSWATTSGNRSTVVGTHASGFGANATVLGYSASANGDGNTALGRLASAADWGPGDAAWDAVPEGVGFLIRCATDPGYVADGQKFVDECSALLTNAEKDHASLLPDTSAGRTYRGTIRTRLRARLNSYAVNHATAVGSFAYARAAHTTAVGAYARASAAEGTAVGNASVASGFESTALGRGAFATAPRATAAGEHAEAHGADTTALGREARAGGVSADWLYLNVESYLADPDRTDYANVIIGGEPYSVRALEAVADLGPDNLPARLAATTGGTAVGAGAQASGTDAIALGRAAAATGSNAIAVGAGASAGADQVVIGRDGHSYRLPGLAPDGGVARLLAVDARGQLVAGAVQAGTGAPDFGVRLAALEAEAASSGERVTTLESGFSSVDDRLGKEDDGADRDGNAYQRITALDNDLGSEAQLAHSDGSAYQRIASVREIVETATSEDPAAIVAARAERTVEESTRALTAEDTKLREAIENADSADRVEKVRIRTGTGEERTVVTLRGATNEQIMTLVALLTDRRLSTTVAAGADGEPVGTTMTEFLELDELHGHNVVSTKERLAYLFQALYGPDYAGRADGSTDSDAPHRQSIEGRVRIIELDDEGKQLREADDGLGAGAHRVVVQETSPQDGRGRLRTMPFDNFDGAAALRKVDALTGRVDNLRRDLDKLDTHVDRVAAMTSALTALPNAVAGGDRYSLGMGVGHHRGAQALALGMSVRLVGERNVFANAGVALGEGSTVTARAGVSVSW